LNGWSDAPAYILRNAVLALAVTVIIPGACGNNENNIFKVQGAKWCFAENGAIFSTKGEFFPAQNIQ
jgi:hypothetical protein